MICRAFSCKNIFSCSDSVIWDDKIMISGSKINYEWRKPLHANSKDYSNVRWCNKRECGVLVSNILHWIIYMEDDKRRVACFDISLETWVDELDIPDQEFDVKLRVYDGCLCVEQLKYTRI